MMSFDIDVQRPMPNARLSSLSLPMTPVFVSLHQPFSLQPLVAWTIFHTPTPTAATVMIPPPPTAPSQSHHFLVYPISSVFPLPLALAALRPCSGRVIPQGKRRTLDES